MDRDGLKAIIGGMAEALRLVATQPEFQKAQATLIAPADNSAEVSLTDALDMAVSLLDLVYEELDREIPPPQEDPNLSVYREFLGKCWREK